MSDVRLTFKEMCAKFEVTPRTLRYYEYIELLSPERQGRSRFYGARECARMTLILRGRKFGFQLEELRQWLLIYDQDGTEAQMEVFLGMAERKLKELKERQIQLAETLDELERPERVEQIKKDHEKRVMRMQANMRPNPLRPDAEPIDIDDLYGQQKMCLSCHK